MFRNHLSEEVKAELENIPTAHCNYLMKLFERAPVNLLEAIEVRHVPNGEIFIEENEKVSNVYFLLSGHAKALERRILGTEYNYMEFSPITLLGSMEILLGSDTYQATLIALSPCVFLTMRAQAFRNWIESDPNALLMESKNLVRCLLEQGKKERVFLFLQGQDRLFKLFIDEYAHENNPVYEIKKTRQQLSDCSGLSVRTVNRALKSMKDEGYISIVDHRIFVSREQYKKMSDRLECILS